MASTCGGLARPEQANYEIQQMCNEMRHYMEKEAMRQFNEFKAVQFARQIVAGVNYFVKIHVGGPEYIHARIYEPLPGMGGPGLHSIQKHKSQHDEILFF